MSEYSEQFNLEELVSQMMAEIIRLKAETMVLRHFAYLSFQQGTEVLHQEQFDTVFDKALSEAKEALTSSHEWYEGYWKQILGNLDL